MTSAEKISAEAISHGAADSDAWLKWLKAEVDPRWRRGQWDQDRWMMTVHPGDETTTVRKCAVVACMTAIPTGRICTQCANARKQAGTPLEEFIASYQPVLMKNKVGALAGGKRCAAQLDDRRCPRVAHHRSVCQYHYARWRRACRRSGEVSLQVWLTRARFVLPPSIREKPCQVVGCDEPTRSSIATLCMMHYYRYVRRSDRQASEPEWAKTTDPRTTGNQFTLLVLSETMRWELLYAIQQRDRRGGKLDINAVRCVIRFVRGRKSLARMSESQIAKAMAAAGIASGANAGCHIREFAASLRSAYAKMLGIQPHDQMIWDVQELGIGDHLDPSVWRPRTRLDLSEIKQQWLRELFRVWGREQKSSDNLRRIFRATTVASTALSRLQGGGDAPESLTADDATAVFDALRVAKKKRPSRRVRASTSEFYTADVLRGFYSNFFEMIAFGRRSGLNIGAGFLPNPGHQFVDTNEDDEMGKALPNTIIRQLDSHLDAIGGGVVHGTFTPEVIHQLFKTVYILLRDTGRRPLEIASLRRDCLIEGEDGQPVLVYDNHKSGRMGRKLPITSSTASALEAWNQVRALNIDAMPSDYLFPDSRPGGTYLRSWSISTTIRKWVADMDLRAGEIRRDGSQTCFDRKNVFPYAFRHSYAQRHADSGTPVDVLRELMDHQSVQTTSGYYVVTADRKRAAVEIIGKLAIDRHGAPLPMTDSITYQMRSVAVPFGNCVEPSNVKAGGQACPIRFQCAGCGFYRPDPSFIPAIEAHLHSLRSDKETAYAMDTAGYVIDNLEAQIRAFAKVLSVMQGHLEQLDLDERQRVEDASSALRKVRAGATLPLTVVKRSEEPRW